MFQRTDFGYAVVVYYLFKLSKLLTFKDQKLII